MKVKFLRASDSLWKGVKKQPGYQSSDCWVDVQFFFLPLAQWLCYLHKKFDALLLLCWSVRQQKQRAKMAKLLPMHGKADA